VLFEFMAGQKNFTEISSLTIQKDDAVPGLVLSQSEQLTSEVLPADVQHNTTLEIV